MLQSVQTHFGSHTSEYGSSGITVDAFHFPIVVNPLIRTVSPALSPVCFQPEPCAVHYAGLPQPSPGSPSFSLSLGMPLLALLNLGYLAGYLVIRFLGVNLLNLLFEGIEFLTDAAGFLLLCLTLSNLSDGILNLLVTFLQEFCSFFLGFLENGFSASFDILNITFILGDGFSISFSRWWIFWRLFSQYRLSRTMSWRYLSLWIYSEPTMSEASLITSSGNPIFLAISMAKKSLDGRWLTGRVLSSHDGRRAWHH